MTRPDGLGQLYDQAWFEVLHAASLRSARAVVPVLQESLGIRSVVDVGCGIGTWLSVFRELGVEDVLGLDGSYVDRAMLQIPDRCFVGMDFPAGLAVDRRFDLAICLEVAEHLSADMAGVLVERLTGMADIVVFSAAIPGQRGTHHINEQWQDYWRALFRDRGFQAVDLLRPEIWGDARVEFFYQQNTICYCNAAALAATGLVPVADAVSLNVVHPVLFGWAKDGGNLYLSRALKLLPGLVRQAVLRRLGIRMLR